MDEEGDGDGVKHIIMTSDNGMNGHVRSKNNKKAAQAS